MYAVVAAFTLDRSWDQEHRRTVEEQLIPTTRQVPGFVSGYWMSDPAEPSESRPDDLGYRGADPHFHRIGQRTPPRSGESRCRL
jgi:hypothetical protein